MTIVLASVPQQHLKCLVAEVEVRVEAAWRGRGRIDHSDTDSLLRPDIGKFVAQAALGGVPGEPVDPCHVGEHLLQVFVAPPRDKTIRPIRASRLAERLAGGEWIPCRIRDRRSSIRGQNLWED